MKFIKNYLSLFVSILNNSIYLLSDNEIEIVKNVAFLRISFLLFGINSALFGIYPVYKRLLNGIQFSNSTSSSLIHIAKFQIQFSRAPPITFTHH